MADRLGRADRVCGADRVARDDRKPGSDDERYANGRLTGLIDAGSGAWPILKLDTSLFTSPWNLGYVAGYVEGQRREAAG